MGKCGGVQAGRQVGGGRMGRRVWMVSGLGVCILGVAGGGVVARVGGWV